MELIKSFILKGEIWGAHGVIMLLYYRKHS